MKAINFFQIYENNFRRWIFPKYLKSLASNQQNAQLANTTDVDTQEINSVQNSTTPSILTPEDPSSVTDLTNINQISVHSMCNQTQTLTTAALQTQT